MQGHKKRFISASCVLYKKARFYMKTGTQYESLTFQSLSSGYLADHNKQVLVLLATTSSKKPSAILKPGYVLAYWFNSIL